MKAIFVLLVLATNALSVAAFAKEATIEKESLTVGNSSSTSFTKIVDTEENRVCYTTTSGPTGGAALVCFDRKEKKSEKAAD